MATTTPRELCGRAHHNNRRMARACVMLTSLEGNIKGKLVLEQASYEAPTTLVGEITGLGPGRHGISINMFGDLSSADAVGLHFNPHGKNHGAPADEERHVGDLGNIDASPEGRAVVKLSDRMLKLIGPLSVIGRSLCIAKRQDDGGKGGHEASLRSGNAGEIVAFGVVGISKGVVVG
jgi:Cu-Zn family superoxide dismutase